MLHSVPPIAKMSNPRRMACRLRRSGFGRDGRAGMTLVELVTVLFISAAIALSAGTVLVSGTRMTLRARKKLRLKRDASMALRYVHRQVRSRTSNEIEVNVDGDMLTLDPDSGNPPYLAKVDGNLVFYNGTDTITLIENYVNSLSFGFTEGHTSGKYYVSTSIGLVRDDLAVEMEAFSTLRN